MKNRKFSCIIGLLAILNLCLGQGISIVDNLKVPSITRRTQTLLEKENKNIVLNIDKSLGVQALKISEEGDTITLTGGDNRGLYYAINNRLASPQLGKGKDFINSPNWLWRYAGDYVPFKAQTYQELVNNNISGYAWQWRQNWRDFKGKTACGDFENIESALVDIKSFADQNLLDFMLVLHIYAVNGPRTEPWFNCANDENVNELIARCRYAAENGIKHIMICADDWTLSKNGRYVCPNEDEQKFFDDSVGKAHGTLMKRIYEALNPEFPSLGISFVGPVYSSTMHKADSEESKRYLRDFDAIAPEAVYLAWTDPMIVGEIITKKDYNNFTQTFEGNRKLVLWDNSECVNQPLPVWESVFYDGAQADHNGIIFINAHALGWAWSWPFTMNANDYLWNPESYDYRKSYMRNLTKLYGEATAKNIIEWRDLFQEVQKFKSENNVEMQEKNLAKMDAILDEISHNKHVDTTRLVAASKGVKDRLNIKAREINLPIIDSNAAFNRDAILFELVNND